MVGCKDALEGPRGLISLNTLFFRHPVDDQLVRGFEVLFNLINVNVLGCFIETVKLIALVRRILNLIAS